MLDLAKRFESGVSEAIERHALPWSAIRLGWRVEDVFAPEPPETGAAVAAVMDGELDALLHLYMSTTGS